MGAVIAPDVHPGVDALVAEDLLQGKGGLRPLPGPLTYADDALVPVVAADIGVVGGHVAQVVDGGVLVDKLVHVAVKAVVGGVNAAEGQQPVKLIGETEEQVGRVGGAQTAAKGDDARIALPAVAAVGRLPDEGGHFVGNEFDPLLMAADAPVGIAGFVRPGLLIDGINGKDHSLSLLDPGGPVIAHVVVFKIKEAAVLTGDEEHRAACVAVDLALHISPQGLAVFLKVLHFHCFLTPIRKTVCP